ncbi:MAG TPA: GNAT family N-acetyltransferase [Candidatus Dormibacteraeota bacterium]|nr:GNAT family N-acetyltransferase [Candidatus Dormibacteraeota bacterium]
MDLRDVQIATPRLILRPLRVEDFDAWAALMADPQAAQFIGGQQARALAWRGFMCMAGAWHLTGVGMFSVLEKDGGRWVGRVGPWRPHGWPGPEIGWAIIRERWGRGYATEAAAASIDFALDTLGWDEVIHCIAPDNSMSQAVARKLGSRHRGVGRMPPPHDQAEIEIWGQSRTEWRAAQRRSV